MEGFIIKVICVNVYEKIVLKGISFLLECFKRDVNKVRVSFKFICLFFLIFILLVVWFVNGDYIIILIFK